MSTRRTPVAQAWLEAPDAGVIELERDWFGHGLPPLFLGTPPRPFKQLRPVPGVFYAEESCFYVSKQRQLFFVLQPDRHPWLDPERTAVYVAGDFNDWNPVGRAEWRLQPQDFGGRRLLVLARPADRFFSTPHQRFKFVTGEHVWIEVNAGAPNAVSDEAGNRNYAIEPDRTGLHRFAFETVAPLELSEAHVVLWKDADGEQRVPLRPEGFFHRLKSDQPLGALVEGNETIFRVFAPRARRVRLKLLARLDEADDAYVFPLARHADGTWEIRLNRDLHGWYYWYFVEGPNDAHGHFDRTFPIVDPYAKALVGRDGPGLVLRDDFVGEAPRRFKTPAWQDLVVAEAHVRDLLAKAPLELSPMERRGFAGLAKWIRRPDFYLKRLGVNAVELQPVQEFDDRDPDEYHWGYMPVNWFAPESSYATAPTEGSQVREFREVVQAFHEQGMAVILDVVYNHVGEPNHLLFLDKHYYFETDRHGHLSNWSGCGNDTRCRSAMMLRLIVDSCIHFIRVYGVDGFRFDLAELIGLEPMRRIEAALKAVKPDVVLIAEPWSFRGHLAGALAETGWASWNDGYRNFIRDYVHGAATREAFEYFLKGSPWYFARWPAQTVNYSESHDDRTWIDVITENSDGNGAHPTLGDRTRTHLMAAVLFASIGIPMIASGQDFLRSKQGVNNTYQRGDLNALDYRRMLRFPATHRYFADWIRFRLSPRGRLLRLFSRPGDGFWAFAWAPDSSAAAVVYNADGSLGPQRLLFAVNPHPHDVTVPLRTLPRLRWRQVCDHERFFGPDDYDLGRADGDELFLPALSCGLWDGE